MVFQAANELIQLRSIQQTCDVYVKNHRNSHRTHSPQKQMLLVPKCVYSTTTVPTGSLTFNHIAIIMLCLCVLLTLMCCYSIICCRVICYYIVISVQMCFHAKPLFLKPLHSSMSGSCVSLNQIYHHAGLPRCHL